MELVSDLITMKMGYRWTMDTRSLRNYNYCRRIRIIEVKETLTKETRRSCWICQYSVKVWTSLDDKGIEWLTNFGYYLAN